MSTEHTALITGFTGQDGSFLAEILLEKGYSVTALVHAASGSRLGCSEHLRDRVELVSGDLLEPLTLRAAIERVRPREIYHLAAPSFIPRSWERPGETLQAIAGSTAAILETVSDVDPGMRVFLAGSAAMFGDARESPQREDTACRPIAPYALAKFTAHTLLGLLRAHAGLFACSGILFNHESERRPDWFVTRKVTRAAAEIKLGLKADVTLGDVSAVRDWSFAGDVMYGAWLMLQQDQPDDYVLASGVPHTVSELIERAFAVVDLDYERYVRIDTDLVRAPEATPSVGDPSKARERLGWRPRVDFDELMERMVRADLRKLRAVAPSP